MTAYGGLRAGFPCVEEGPLEGGQRISCFLPGTLKRRRESGESNESDNPPPFASKVGSELLPYLALEPLLLVGSPVPLTAWACLPPPCPGPQTLPGHGPSAGSPS